MSLYWGNSHFRPKISSSPTWNLNFRVPRDSVKGLLSFSLLVFFPKWSHPLLCYISFICHQLQNLFLIHRSLLSYLNIHISHYLPEIFILMAHRHLKCSMPTIESLIAQPSSNIVSQVFSFSVNGTIHSPSRCSIQKSGSHLEFVSLHNIPYSIHSYFVICL